jgi:hypothetical protein
MALRSTQPLTEMSTRNLTRGKGRPAIKANNLTEFVSRLSRKSGSLDVSQPYRPPWLVTSSLIMWVQGNVLISSGEFCYSLWSLMGHS